MNDMTNEKQGEAPANENAAGEKTASELLKKKFKLFTSVYDNDTEIREITVTEPLVRQQVMAERDGKDSGLEIKSLLSQISDVKSKKAIAALKLRDIGQIKLWLKGLNKQAREVDGLAIPTVSEKTEDDPFAEDVVDEEIFELEPERTFKLLVPVKYEGRTISELKLVEPDIKSATAATKFNEETAQTSAIIASISGETIPVISRLAYRDLHRMEIWLLPFVQHLQMEVTG